MPTRQLVTDASEFTAVHRPVMVKAQVPAKNRAAVGGVVAAAAGDDAKRAITDLLGRRIHGHRVRCVLVEERLEVAAEWFLCVLVDPWGHGLTVRCTDRGGSGVEDRLAAGSGWTHSFAPSAPPSADQLAARWGAVPEGIRTLALRLCKLAIERDLLLLEINPLGVTTDGDLAVLDAHVTVDDAAEFRQPWLASMRAELDEVHPARAWSRRYGGDFTVIDAEGTVALLNTGAGAGMLLIDELARRGVRSYDFSDIRAGTPTNRVERFTAAVDLICAGSRVDTVLVCIHAGITDLRTLTHDLLDCVERLVASGRRVIVRLQGPHSPDASAAFAGRPGVRVEPDLARAVDLVVRTTGSRA